MTSPPLLTGELEPPSLLDPLKTKDNVDHAGLSQLSDLLKELLPYSELKLFNLSLKNNWLTAHPLKETKDATEDLWTTLSNGSSKTVLPLKTNTHINQLTENAKLPKELSISHHSKMSLLEMLILLLPLLLNNQFPSLLMLKTSNSTIQEFSLTAVIHLITESPLLDTLLMLGLLKTLGENLGEKKDTLDSREETLVDLLTLPLTLFFEIKIFYFDLYRN